ncbi:hypothetical protein R1sor_001702 [Riccia sorocarpa]|uniref:GB1/RHD3-type G domain-containing protein n=1 Tax=Riccia sorocarpa TaxID=122646 RepID=A0ABD3H035_9MARC
MGNTSVWWIGRSFLLVCLGLSLVGGRPLRLDEDLPLQPDGDESGEFYQAFPLVEPDAVHTKLSLAKRGLDVISRITNPIAVVAVIGPYRSGKSFLLNQLLSLSCDEGFGVGHMRDTKTRGIWFWGEPLELEVDGQTTSVLFLDTEGFESVGKSTVYDDRIFALAAIMSSVLIYNLPETGRESALQPAKLVWLIQRDFLEGKTVQQMVDQALLPVPNIAGESNSAVVGYDGRKQHSLQFATDFDSKYVHQRNLLKRVIASMISPKEVQGRVINGKDFVALLEQVLDALNQGEIPTAGSVVDSFNRGVTDRCVELYESIMNNLKLPLPDAELDAFHKGTMNDAMELFEKNRFGRHHGDRAQEALSTELEKIYASLLLRNQYLSSQHCEETYNKCEELTDKLQTLKLPSMAKFEAGVARCNRSFDDSCFGASKTQIKQRLDKMWARSRSQFLNDYNRRLFNWLVAFSLVMVVVGRFFLKFYPLELVAWALFILLEVYMHLFWSAESLHYNPTWQLVVGVWEAVVYNPVLDLDRWAVPLAWLSVAAFIFCRYRRRNKHPPPLLPSHEIPRASRFRRLLRQV